MQPGAGLAGRGRPTSPTAKLAPPSRCLPRLHVSPHVHVLAAGLVWLDPDRTWKYLTPMKKEGLEGTMRGEALDVTSDSTMPSHDSAPRGYCWSVLMIFVISGYDCQVPHSHASLNAIFAYCTPARSYAVPRRQMLVMSEQQGYTNSEPCKHTQATMPPSPNHHGALALPYHTPAAFATAETPPIPILHITLSITLHHHPPPSPPHHTHFPSHPALYHSSTPTPTAEERNAQDLPFSIDAALSLRCASTSRSRLWRKSFSLSICARVSLARRCSAPRRCMPVRSCC